MSGPRVRRLAGDVRCVVADNAAPMTLDGTRCYLVDGDAPVVVDPGPEEGLDERLGALTAGRRVAAVALTHAHPDHAGGAERAGRRTGAPLVGSAATLERLGLEGRPLSDGDLAGGAGAEPSLRAVATPGHSDDHLCFWLPRARTVFTGDLVLGSGTAMVGHPDGHMGRYLDSLRRLRALEPRRLYPGHGEPVDDAMDRLAGYLRHRREREEQIREAAEAGAGSVAELRRRVYGELPDGLAAAAEASIRAHLEHLRERGVELPHLEGGGGDDRTDR